MTPTPFRKQHSTRGPRSRSSVRFGRHFATVLALLGSAGTHAAIVCSNPDDVTLTQENSLQVGFLSCTFGTVAGLSFSYSGSEYVEPVPGGASVSATAKNGGNFGGLTRFTAGAGIGSVGGAAGWDTGFNYAAYHNAAGYAWNTNAGGATGYVGVRLDDKGTSARTLCGWLNITHTDGANAVTLPDSAFQRTADLAITTGAVTEAAMVGILAALGAGGLAAWRRLRKQQRV